MANGYIQVKVVSTGSTILASDHNDECEALEDAFDITTGHNHDGSVGGGAPIPTAGLDNLTNTSAGITVADGANAFLVRTLTGTTNEITVTNGTGVSGNPTLSLPSALTFTGKTITGGTFSSPTLTGTPIADVLQTSGSSGVAIKNSGGTTVLTVGSANTTNSTFAGAVNINGSEAVTSNSNTQTLTNKTITSGRYNQLLDTNGNVMLGMTPTASAVNYVNITNNATGGNPIVEAAGTDANINLNLLAKGTGNVRLLPGSGSNIAQIFNGAGTLAAALSVASLTSSRTFTFPDTAMTFAGRDVAQTFTAAQNITSATAPATLNRTDGNPQIITLQTSGTNRGQIGADGTYSTSFYDSGGTLRWGMLNASPYALRPAADNTTDIGVAAARVATVYANGIDFGNNVSADTTTLDYYEEGSFTPTLVGLTTSGTGTYTTQYGRYTRIGRLVTYQIGLGWSAHTGTGNMRISGLPFTSAALDQAAPVSYYDTLTVGAGLQLGAIHLGGSTNINLYSNNPAGGAAGLAMDTAVALILLNGSYIV